MRDTRTRDDAVAHVCAFAATVDSYVYVFMPRVPVDLITTIGLTNLIDVHQLFGPPFEGRLIPLSPLPDARTRFPANLIFSGTHFFYEISLTVLSRSVCVSRQSLHFNRFGDSSGNTT